MSTDYSDFSMLDLFRIEAENHSRILESGLVEVEAQQSLALAKFGGLAGTDVEVTGTGARLGEADKRKVLTKEVPGGGLKIGGGAADFGADGGRFGAMAADQGQGAKDESRGE